MNAPKYSIIIPLYNKKDSIQRTIQSILTQSCQDFEIIIINDGSSDGSDSIAAEIAASHSQIQLHHQANQGVSAARNHGAQKANGQYLCFLDADDQWHTFFLSEIDKLIAKYPEAGAYATRYCYVNAYNKISYPRIKLRGKGSRLIEDYFDCASRGELPFFISSLCIPKSTFNDTNGFPVGQAMGEDQAFWSDIALKNSIAYSFRVCMMYTLAAENKAMHRILPKEECDFSRELYRRVQQGLVPKRLKHSILAYTGGHILHIAAQNIRGGDLGTAQKLLSDSRTWMRPIRKIGWSAMLLYKHYRLRRNSVGSV